jgi:dTDP-4-dehydrorhamnose reductase
MVLFDVVKPRILLTGKNGQLGWELERMLGASSELKSLDRGDLDLREPASIRKVIRNFQPQIILNAAAYTAVDKAETEEALARAVNADAPAVMAEEAQKVGALLIHYSTDYVFDGSKNDPYVESDATNPINAYGQTKLAGEKAIQNVGGRYLIFRTEWVYATRGKNFLLTILRLATEREELRIVADQIGAPTWSHAIAHATAKMITDEWQRTGGAALFDRRCGIYHMTAAGQASWFDFTSAIIENIRACQRRPDWLRVVIGDRPIVVKRINPITTRDYPTPARRPAYSVLSNSLLKQTFGVELPDWRIQLKTALALDG